MIHIGWAVLITMAAFVLGFLAHEGGEEETSPDWWKPQSFDNLARYWNTKEEDDAWKDL